MGLVGPPIVLYVFRKKYLLENICNLYRSIGCAMGKPVFDVCYAAPFN
ncbi:hypothetical protein C427_5223 [Paraglaciecola psychrophila 170]|uniref:Uncharacterized protein n=1 Tax=Paraglaciecola psychrophila 170 TaxID=1129794 RepID=K7A2D6_9ALTE|nr:hypothetical protein C427_5223 [Paraglaciecola psychrophila 170]GAC36547.1 hypothetical protein GPSY_0909 [Paraglaciecola psychrophila 170]